ncbi:MAG: integrase arm-type DNA-binding domain-containing protein, partial [Sphingobium sp.]
REKLLTFGRFPEVGLAEARARRKEARELLCHGIDPAVEFARRKARAVVEADASFRVKAEEWLAENEPWWSAANAFRVRSRIEKDIYPEFGKLPVSQVTGDMVLVALRKIERRGAIETAKRVRGYILASAIGASRSRSSDTVRHGAQRRVGAAHGHPAHGPFYQGHTKFLTGIGPL